MLPPDFTNCLQLLKEILVFPPFPPVSSFKAEKKLPISASLKLVCVSAESLARPFFRSPFLRVPSSLTSFPKILSTFLLASFKSTPRVLSFLSSFLDPVRPRSPPVPCSSSHCACPMAWAKPLKSTWPPRSRKKLRPGVLTVIFLLYPRDLSTRPISSALNMPFPKTSIFLNSLLTICSSGTPRWAVDNVLAMSITKTSESALPVIFLLLLFLIGELMEKSSSSSSSSELDLLLRRPLPP
mmetsp:Transcript_26419/g.49998  ORF Transcript_26419/g.49998 Transcript_26419/m.49998 type:complete len:240 (+) Transcript_26419:2034-2753(+)